MSKLPAELLTPDEMDRLLRACGRSSTGLRNRALLVTLWRGGLRISEALDLRPQDVNWQTGEVRILHGKGDKARTTGLGQMGLAVVAEWKVRRASLGLTSGPLFCTLRGGRLPGSYPRTAIKRLAAKAGIERRCHPHQLRHMCAVDLISEGARLTDVQLLLGHESAATTSRYLARLGASEAVKFAVGRV